MEDLPERHNVCPHCSKRPEEENQSRSSLPHGIILHGNINPGSSESWVTKHVNRAIRALKLPEDAINMRDKPAPKKFIRYTARNG